MSSNGEDFDPIEEGTRKRIAQGKYATQAVLNKRYEEVQSRQTRVSAPTGWRRIWKHVTDVLYLVTFPSQVPQDSEITNTHFGLELKRADANKNPLPQIDEQMTLFGRFKNWVKRTALYTALFAGSGSD